MNDNILARTFENISQAVSEANPTDDDDYEQDGLLYCGKCHTQKQTRIEILGKILTPPCSCKCVMDRIEKERREQEEAEKARRIASRRALCFGSALEKFGRQTFDADDKKGDTDAMISINRYAVNFEKMREIHKGLLIYGNTGVGKSFAAACIANYVIDLDHTCFMTDFSTIINELTGLYQGKQDYLDDLNRNTLLIIDDFAVERSTEYANEIVKNVIEMRYKSGKPLIVTTNLTADEIFNCKDITKKRVYSRLIEMCVPINFKGGDRRRNILADDYANLKELLNLSV